MNGGGEGGGGGLRTYAGAVVLITGGASGIGAALARSLAQKGATLVLADLQFEEADALAASLRAQGAKATADALDVTDWPAVQRWIEGAFREHGRIDYLFNNAGIGVGGEALYYELEDWTRVLAVNLNGVIHGVQAVYPILCQQGFGHIVNTASMAGLLPSPNVLGYTTTKHAVVGLSLALRAEAEAHGVRVSVFCPGVINTPIIDGGKYGKMVGPMPAAGLRPFFERLGIMDVDLFAARALADVARNRAIIIHPAKWRWIWRAYRLWPGFGALFGRQSLAQVRRLAAAAKG